MCTSSFLPRILVAAPLMLASLNAATVQVNSDVTYQSIVGFGASITGNSEVRVPVYQSESFRDFVAYDLGLSVLRMQVEPGISTQEIFDPEAIRYQDFEMDGNKGKGVGVMIDFTRGLIERDPSVNVIGTAWSAPGWMKENGKTHGTQGGFILNTNRGYDDDNRLRDDRYDHYAKWLVEYTKFLQEQGTPLYGISPQNELMFTQYFDSAMYTGEEYARIVRKLGQRYELEGMQRPLIFGPEDMTQASYNPNGFGQDATRHNPYVEHLMDPATAPYFDVWATHGYTDGVNQGGTQDPGTYWERIKQFDRPYWITEGGTGGHDWPAPLNNGIAGYLHFALVAGNVELFTAWQLQDPEPSTHSIMAWDTPTKKTYAAMHYWRFVRPGFIRIDANASGQGSSSLRVSAFKDPTNERLVIVAINTSAATATMDLQLSGAVEPAAFDVFQTSASHNMAHLGSASVVDNKLSHSLPGQSITTFVVLQPVEGLNLDAEAIEVERGLSKRITPMLLPEDASNRRITWTSSNPEVASVNGAGWVTAHEEGTATITATTADGGFVDTTQVQVTPRISWQWADWHTYMGYLDSGSFLGWLYIDYDSDWVYSYGIDSWFYLPDFYVEPGSAWAYFMDPAPQPLSASASAPVQATISSEPRAVAAAAPGHTNVAPGKVITYSAASDGSPGEHLIDGNNSTEVASRWSVERYPNWALIDLLGLYDISEFRLYPLENRGYAYKIEVSADGVEYTMAVNRLNNRTGGRVLANNVSVSAVRYVLLTITGGGSYNGTWISLGELEVFGAETVVPVSGITTSHASITRGVGQTWQLTADVAPFYANNKNVTWTTSNNAVATVDQNGLVTATGVGNATITATTQEGAFTAQTHVEVQDGSRWGRWTLDATRHAQTGQFVGTVYVYPDSDWLYAYELDSWLYLPEESIDTNGAWGMILR